MTHQNDADDIARAMVENSELIRELDETASKPMPFWPAASNDEIVPAAEKAKQPTTAELVMLIGFVVFVLFLVADYMGWM